MVQDVVSGQPRVGRFGWKAQQATLLAFSGDAYVNEMGITSRLFPQENAPNGNTDLLALFDNVADPEDSRKSTSYLAVAKITATKICITDKIAPKATGSVTDRRRPIKPFVLVRQLLRPIHVEIDVE